MVRMCICRVRVGSATLICRIAKTSRGPSAMANSASVSARRQVWVRPCSSVWLWLGELVLVDVGGGAFRTRAVID